MKVYICAVDYDTKCATTREEAQLYHWDYLPEIFELEVSDDATSIYRVYIPDSFGDTYVETLEEAKAIIRSLHGQEKRRARRWRIPIEGTQLTLF